MDLLVFFEAEYLATLAAARWTDEGFRVGVGGIEAVGCGCLVGGHETASKRQEN